MTELLDRPMEQSREGETNAGARGDKLSSSPPKVRLPGKGAPSPQSVGVAARSSRAGSGESTALRERSGFPPSAWLSQKAAAFRHDDGDVPGWVLITLMTAGANMTQ